MKGTKDATSHCSTWNNERPSHKRDQKGFEPAFFSTDHIKGEKFAADVVTPTFLCFFRPEYISVRIVGPERVLASPTV